MPRGEPDRGVNKRERGCGCRKKHLFSLPPNDCRAESISSLGSVLVISSLASSARLVIARDWPYLSLTIEASIRVGGEESLQFD